MTVLPGHLVADAVLAYVVDIELEVVVRVGVGLPVEGEPFGAVDVHGGLEPSLLVVRDGAASGRIADDFWAGWASAFVRFCSLAVGGRATIIAGESMHRSNLTG